MTRTGKRTSYINNILTVLELGAVVGTSLVAPNLLQVVGKSLGKNEKQKELRTVIHYMKRQRLITVSESGDQYTVTITTKGRKRSLQARFDELSIETPEKWDERWRLVMFDIPERHATSRKALTNKLQQLGFQLIQKSVWIHPFPCQEVVEVCKVVYPNIGPYTIYLEADYVSDQYTLLKQFKHLLV